MGVDIPTIHDNATQVAKYMENVRNEIHRKGISEEEAIKRTTELKLDYSFKHGWPWVGPEGHPPDLPIRLKKIPSTFSADNTLITNKYPAGRLIGYITHDHDSLSKLRDGSLKLEPNYIVDFAVKVITISSWIKSDSRLYLAVNDSTLPEWQYDNFGILMVTIER